MKRVNKISFEALMKECMISDPSEFRRLVRSNRLPQISSRKPITQKDANKIARRLIGRNVDWYKQNQQARDLVDEGPLKRNSTTYDKGLVEIWYSKIIPNSGVELPDWDCLLGVVCTGGFLEGEENSEFSLRLDSRINVLIGDRGSGKSTALNLISLLADTVRQETDVLVTKVTDLLSSENSGETSKKDKKADFTRRIRSTLRHYNVRKIAIFFTRHKKIFCCFVNLKSSEFDLLELPSNGDWESVNSNELVKPSILVLQQGEVIKIAEARDRFYINRVLDALYPKLYQRRINLVNDVRKLLISFEYNPQRKKSVDVAPVRQFIHERRRELRAIDEDVKRGYFRETNFKILQFYIDQHYSFVHQHFPVGYNDVPILELLKIGEEAFYTTYVGYIIGFLGDKLSEIAQLKNDTVTLRSDSEADQVYTGNDELLDAVRQVIGFLNGRLGVLSEWASIYSKPRIQWNKAFNSLVTSYSQLLKDKVELIEEQEITCKNITETLTRDELEIKIFTINKNLAVSSAQDEIDSLSNLETLFQQLLQVTHKTKLNDISTMAQVYDSTTNRTLKILRELREGTEDTQLEFVYNPVDVQLRQGSVYRTLRQLSFGQKSGIILKMVLATTGNYAIILDQPEDNLDASSVVNMLTPTLNRLGRQRQVIIATHNSNLVMGLRANNLIVLESWGDSGRIKIQGSPLNQDIVREMVDVLEGGVHTFKYRMNIFAEFITRVTGQIKDMDLRVIEHSFRRQTIDKFRNFLQPVISDRAALDFARHELKHREPTDIHNYLQNIREEVGKLEENPRIGIDQLLKRVEQVSKLLDIHITQLQGAIEEIRLMDTEAKPVDVDLYNTLTEISKDYLTKLRDERDVQIEIDKSLFDYFVYIDKDHLKLLLRNLFENSLRATEQRAFEAFDAGNEVSEMVEVNLVEIHDNQIVLMFSDNGIGIPDQIKEKLYIEQCTSQLGRDHGLGGVIISKLLEINGGSIRILESNKKAGTRQIVTLIKGNNKQ